MLAMQQILGAELTLAQGVELPGIDYAALAPLLVIFGAGCAGVVVEALAPRSARWPSQLLLTLLGLAVAAVMLGMHLSSGAGDIVTLAGAVAVDGPALFLWGTLLALALGAVLLIADRTVEPGGAFVADAAVRIGTAQDRAQNSARQGPWSATPATPVTASTMGVAGSQTEVFPLFLFSLGGMMAFVSANDLLTMFVALEVLSLPLYLMCGLARRRRLLSQEAAVKYFLLGAFASAFFLYGIALLYGYAGSVRLAQIAQASGGTDRSDTLLFGGLAMLVIGLMFKASVGPFHTWTPDVYQGAPTPVTAFMASCTKVAAFGGILRVLNVGFETTSWEWRGVLWGIAIASMVIGAVLGLTQTDVKRMIAYSSVAHAGFILVGAIALTEQGLSGTMFYLLAYGFTTLAAFGVVTLVRDSQGEATHLAQWAGLARRSPLTAWVFAFLLFAMAGIPATSGFTAKFAVFSAALADGMAPLVVIALVASAVAAFFYLRVVVLMFFSEPAADGPTVTVPGGLTTAAITLGVVVTVLLGVLPSFALDWAALGGFAS